MDTSSTDKTNGQTAPTTAPAPTPTSAPTPAAASTPATAAVPDCHTCDRHHKAKKIVMGLSHVIVLILSVLLIVYISYDTFKNIPFLNNSHYMTFQFWVCVVFLADFFIELALSEDKRQYLRSHWFFFIISIPYLNIITETSMHIPEDALYWLRYVPLVRGCYSLALVMGNLTQNHAASLIFQYFAILCTLVYILSLLFYYEEYGLNKYVHTFWDALYFSCMNVTTVGCYFSAVTPIGKIISVILPTAGMLMLPLFTVYVTDRVKNFDLRKQIDLERYHIKHDDKSNNSSTPSA